MTTELWTSQAGPIVYVDSPQGQGYAELLTIGFVQHTVRPIGTDARWYVRKEWVHQ